MNFGMYSDVNRTKREVKEPEPKPIKVPNTPKPTKVSEKPEKQSKKI